MSDHVYAVIDTNVIVSALLTQNSLSPTVRVVECVLGRRIIPVFNDEILMEYRQVLLRPKFKFEISVVDILIKSIEELGNTMERTYYTGELPDSKDRVFYEVSLTGDSYLVTGNLKHFPKTAKVVTPAEMMAILDDH